MTIKLNLTPKFVLAFLALTFVMHEMHEIVHTSVGFLICGCWGLRDFNVWGLCEGCAEQHPIAALSTIAGPLFTFIMIWVGTLMIRPGKTSRQKAIGFSLIFANLPFGRLLTAALGGGDEVWALRQEFNNHSLVWITGFLLIVLITMVPLWKAYRIIGNKRKTGWFLLFFLAPTFIDLLVVLGIMNSLLQKGILDKTWILGSPMLVTVWTFFVTGIFLLTKNKLPKLAGE